MRWLIFSLLLLTTTTSVAQHPLLLSLKADSFPIAEGDWEQGRRTGNWKFRDTENRLLAMGPFTAGERSGTWKVLNETTNLPSETASFVHGLPHGIYTLYFPNGVVHISGNYVHGHRSGTWTYRNPDSTIYLVENYQDNLSYERIYFYQNGNKMSVEQYQNAALHGITVRYYPHGKLMSKVHYRNNLQHGQAQSWDTAGNTDALLNFKNGLEHGKFTSYRSGKTYTTGRYRNGVLHGKLKQYDHKGRMVKMEVYRKGNLVKQYNNHYN